MLAEPYIEGYAESFQIFFQACQLFFISNLQEFCQTLFFLQSNEFLAIDTDNALSGFNDIITVVAVFRERNSGRHFVQLLNSQVSRNAAHFLQLQQLQITCIDGSCQIVHLVASVIDIVFAFHIIACSTQQVNHSTAYSGTAGMAYMQRTSGISTYIFNLNAAQAVSRQIAVVFTGSQNACQQISGPVLFQIEIDEAGTGNFHFIYGSTVQIIYNSLCNLTRCTMQATGRLHSKVGCKIAEFLLRRNLQHNLGQCTRFQSTVIDSFLRCIFNGSG